MGERGWWQKEREGQTIVWGDRCLHLTGDSHVGKGENCPISQQVGGDMWGKGSAFKGGGGGGKLECELCCHNYEVGTECDCATVMREGV